MEEVYTKQGFSKYEIYCIGKEHFQNYEVTPAKHAQKKIAYHKDFTCHIPLIISKPVSIRGTGKFVCMRLEMQLLVFYHGDVNKWLK